MRDWQRNQLLNFSHDNYKFINQTPRQAREAFGKDHQIDDAFDQDTVVGYGCAVIAIAALLITVLPL